MPIDKPGLTSVTAGVRVSTISALASALRAAASSWPSIERSVAMSVSGPGKTGVTPRALTSAATRSWQS